MVDVGPELFDDKGESVDTDIEAPLVAGVAEGALATWVVEGGEAGGGAGADDFAGVEDFLAGVGAGDDGACESVADALDEATVAEGVVAIVFVGDGGDDGFDEEVFAGLIDDSVPEVAPIGYAAGAELGVRIALEIVACDGEGDEEGGVVEGIFKGGGELLFWRLRRELDVGADGAEVWKDAEDAGGLLGGGLVGLRLGKRRVDSGGGRGL